MHIRGLQWCAAVQHLFRPVTCTGCSSRVVFITPHPARPPNNAGWWRRWQFPAQHFVAFLRTGVEHIDDIQARDVVCSSLASVPVPPPFAGPVAASGHAGAFSLTGRPRHPHLTFLARLRACCARRHSLLSAPTSSTAACRRTWLPRCATLQSSGPRRHQGVSYRVLHALLLPVPVMRRRPHPRG